MSEHMLTWHDTIGAEKQQPYFMQLWQRVKQVTHTLDELVGRISRSQIREDQCVYSFSLQPSERINLVAQFFIECKLHLHFSVDG